MSEETAELLHRGLITPEDVQEARVYVQSKRLGPQDRLALEIERALQEYIGTDSFPSNQWPEFARTIAVVVRTSEVTRSDYACTPGTVVANAKEHLQAIADLMRAIAELTE